jgi:quinol monooxygenase YgiN
MLIDLYKFPVEPGFAEEVAEQMKEHAVLTRGDEGCIFAYAFQSNADENTQYLLMAWEDSESVVSHMEKEHDIRFRNFIDARISGPAEHTDWKLLA